MRRHQVPLTALMVLIFVNALGITAVRAGTVGWAQAVSWLVLLVLAVATGGALFARGPRRAFWGGMAVFGWQFLAVHAQPEFFGLRSGVKPPGSLLAGELAAVLHPYAETQMSARPPQDFVGIDTARGVYLRDIGGKAARARDIGLGLLNLVYAVVGGVLVVRLAGPADRGLEERGQDSTPQRNVKSDP